jgi:cellulose 1,4-beta-cellobiosidase
VLSWTPTATATSYSIYRSTDGGSTYSQLATSTTAGYTDGAVTNGSAYYYKITATNGYGTSGYSSVVNATPAAVAPSAPTGLSAVAGNTQVSLTWNTVIGSTSYNVLRSTSSGTEAQLVNVLAANYTNTGLTNGTTYYYKVQAVNGNGTSVSSLEVSATPTNNLIPVGATYITSGYLSDWYSISISPNTHYTITMGANDQFWTFNRYSGYNYSSGVIEEANTNTTLWFFCENPGSVTAILTSP